MTPTYVKYTHTQFAGDEVLHAARVRPPCLVQHGPVYDITLSSASLKTGTSFGGILEGFSWEVLEGRMEMAL